MRGSSLSGGLLLQQAMIQTVIVLAGKFIIRLRGLYQGRFMILPGYVESGVFLKTSRVIFMMKSYGIRLIRH